MPKQGSKSRKEKIRQTRLKEEIVAYLQSPEGKEELRQIRERSNDMKEKFLRARRVESELLTQPMTI